MLKIQTLMRTSSRRCPRCLTGLKDGRCPRCDWPGFRLPEGSTERSWKIYFLDELLIVRKALIKHEAHVAVKRAVRNGRITKPDRCARCKCREKIVFQAHHRSYRPEDWLDVIWLCGRCHWEAKRGLDPKF